MSVPPGPAGPGVKNVKPSCGSGPSSSPGPSGPRIGPAIPFAGDLGSASPGASGLNAPPSATAERAGLSGSTPPGPSGVNATNSGCGDAGNSRSRTPTPAVRPVPSPDPSEDPPGAGTSAAPLTAPSPAPSTTPARLRFVSARGISLPPPLRTLVNLRRPSLHPVIQPLRRRVGIRLVEHVLELTRQRTADHVEPAHRQRPTLEHPRDVP